MLTKETAQSIALILGNGYKCYYNKDTQQVLEADKVTVEEKKSGVYTEYVPLETSVMFGFMQQYCDTVDDFEKQSELMETLLYEQPFQSFKRKVYALSLADDWIQFRADNIIKHLGLC